MKVIVVGRGLMGSAAARHLARAGHQVVLIGLIVQAALAIFGTPAAA